MTRRQILRRHWPDRSGSVLVEFALLCPFLVTLLLGVFDLGPTLMAKFKVASATQAVADLATQSAIIQASDVANFFAAGSDVMAPFSGTPLALRITNIASDGSGNAFVYWSCAAGSLAPKIARSPITSTPTGTPLPNLLLLTDVPSPAPAKVGKNTSFVMVESSYVFTSPAGLVFPSTQTFTAVAYTVPRVSTYIAATNNVPNYKPAAPVSTQYAYPFSSGGVSCSFAV